MANDLSTAPAGRLTSEQLVGKLAASLHRLSRSLSFGASSRGASSAPTPSGLPPELSTERADVELAAGGAVRLEQ